MTLEPPFASTDDLAARWPAYPTGQDEWAETLLSDASYIILGEYPTIADDDSKAEQLKIVTCNMARRAMSAGAEEDDLPYGAKSAMDVTGPITRQVTFESPAGALFLWPSDRKLLGQTKQQAFMIDLMPDPDTARY